MKKFLMIFIPVLLVVLLLLTPQFMKWGWRYSKKKHTEIFILDKTVLNHTYQEHISFNWVLNNNRYVKPDGNIYLPMFDYSGFFPDEKGGYEISDIKPINQKELEQLSLKYDMIYYTDAYGMYWAEWYDEYPFIKPKYPPIDVGERSPLIYGGLNRNELELLRLMKNQRKLIINEFNIIASPTPHYIRLRYEDEFDIDWSGWVGRYFDDLDTNVNKELPNWLVNNYMEQNNGQWPFTESGIAFVRNDDKIIILEDQTHLIKDIPIIITNSQYTKPYGLPAVLKYSFWFDICSSGPKNDVISEYHIVSNSKGDSTLSRWNIPNVFPAVIKSNQDYPYYYFAGDFADNKISMRTSYYKHIEKFDFLFYGSAVNERAIFFWKYYRPLVNKILKDYYGA